MRKRKTDSLFWGIVLLVIGFIFLLENLGVNISIGEIIKFWPVILIYFGGKALYEYFTQNSRENTIETQDENGKTDEK